jgi:hypothetical protein
MTSLRFGLCACLASLLATGCPAGDDTSDTANDSEAMTTAPSDTSTGSAEESTGSSTNLSHAADIQPIWDAKCVDACHDPTGEWGFILDMSGDGYAAIVGIASSQVASMDYVTAGDPDNSYLWHKINNTQVSVGGSGLPMPKARSGMAADVMTADELATIEEWIAGGAPP